MEAIARSGARLALAALAVSSAAACAPTEGNGDTAELSPLAAEGREVALDNSCMACHPVAEDHGMAPPGIAPSLKGLAGSDVRLSDGRVVTADADYLRRAITDPDAEIVQGYTASMPALRLDNAAVDALVAYIEALADR